MITPPPVPDKASPPVSRTPAGYDDYLALPADGRIVEWANEEIISYMPAKHEHQVLLNFLNQLLSAFIRLFSLGEVIIAPFEVKLWPGGPSREPDILFLATENLGRLTNRRVEGPPDLIIEIISPGTAKIDRVDKFLEYEQAGVKEYWIIDPRPRRQQADFYILNETGSFRDAPIDEETGVYQAATIPGFSLALDWLWQDPLPDPQIVLAEMVLSNETIPAGLREAYRVLHQALTGREQA